MIRNIVFDMGNVLLRFDEGFFMDRAGLTDPADRAWMEREVFRSVEWAMTDRGSLTPGEAADIMKRRVPERLRPYVDRLVCGWSEEIVPVPGMAKLVGMLKSAGYRIYLLSNAGINHGEYWSNVPGSTFFDGLLVSAEVGCVKPEREIYGLLLERFSLVPEECVFVDDHPLNVEAATRQGMRGIVFHGDAAELKEKLGAIGVECCRSVQREHSPEIAK